MGHAPLERSLSAPEFPSVLCSENYLVPGQTNVLLSLVFLQTVKEAQRGGFHS